jgi:hypothetical protein
MTLPSSVRYVLLGLVIGALLGVAASSAVRVATQRLPQPPALLAGPSGDGSDLLQRRFPIGSPEANLIHELWSEGFRPQTGLHATKRSADWERLGDGVHDICAESEHVDWTANAAGEITSLSGGRYTTCS